MTKPDWKIFYSDGSTFDSTMGAPHEAPSRGFICAIGYRKSGPRYIAHMDNWYFYNEDCGEWWGFKTFDGVIDYMCERERPYAFKQGRTVRDSEFDAIMERAHKDPDFPMGGRA